MTYHELLRDAKLTTSHCIAKGLISLRTDIKPVSIRTIQKQKKKLRIEEAKAKLAKMRVVSPA